ncbi:MAG: glycosyltransferase family 2 protein [Pseudomonadota bacterium]|nr:glycosyltransferase family 2 protein [Pseudomonadota bacterium]
MKTTLLVMTLNEIEGMKVIMPQVNSSWFDQIIVVDGGSTDGTVEWAKDHGYDTYIQKEKGFRHAYAEVWPQVTGDVVVTFSPDGNSIPDILPSLLAKMNEGYDMVIVSRYFGSAKSADDDVVTGFGNWFFTRTVNLLHGGRYTDVMVIFRAYRKSLASDLELLDDEAFSAPEKVFRTRISWEPLLSVRAVKAKLKIAEIPGDEPPRIGGERKLKILQWGAAYYFQFIRELWFWSPK